MNAIEIGAFEAKTKFAELLARVARGQEFLITKRGRPVARLVGKGRKSSTVAKRSRAALLYRRIQNADRRLTTRQLEESVRESRAELLRRGDKLLA